MKKKKINKSKEKIGKPKMKENEEQKERERENIHTHNQILFQSKKTTRNGIQLKDQEKNTQWMKCVN